jgi:glycosyltransferase involved in cell wall biosynthesis
MGSFFYFSGLPQAIKRFAELTHDSDGIKLLLIGGGEQASELRKLVDELGVSNKVIFTGFVTYDVLPKYLRLASIAINTLQISQVSSVAFPHKVLQYLASDLPVVSTRLDGLVSTLDGLVGLNWADSPEEVVDLALQLLTEDPIPLDKAKVSSRLSALFSPPSALRSLEETLEYAITTSNRN